MSFTIQKKEAILVQTCKDNTAALSNLMKTGKGRQDGGRRYQQPGLNLNQQRKLAIIFETKNQDFCRIHAFPPFSLIGRVPWKVNQDHCLMLIIANTSMASHSWFLGLLKNLLLLPTHKELLKDQAGNLNPYVTQNSLRRVEWTTSGRTYLQQKYQTLSQTIGEHLQSSIMSQFERSNVAGILNGRYLPLDLI